MNLKLEAHSPVDGFGIVRVGSKLRLIRPPYSSASTPVLPEEALQDAVIRHGFFASAIEFANWRELIDYLNGQLVTARRSLGAGLPDSVDGTSILEVAPREILEQFLDRVEKDIIPQRLFDHAEEFLLKLLGSSAGASSPEIRNRAVRLLQLNKSKRTQFEIGEGELTKRDVRFAGLEKSGELERSLEWAKTIRERGCVFA
jgi:hypothetical protein